MPKAASNRWGVVKLSTSLQVSNTDQAYINSIGVSGDGSIAFNLLRNGALRHVHGQVGWTVETAPGAAIADLIESERYLGLATSAQFSQSGNRLNLMPASTTTLAGVYIATDMSDDREARVPQARTIRNWVEGYAWNKAAVYTRSETEDYVARVLAAYASIAWVNDNYYTKAQVDALLKGKVSGFGTEALHVMSHAEHQALSSINKNHTYLVFAD